MIRHSNVRKMPDIKTKSRNTSKVNSRINYSGPLKSVLGKDSATSPSNRVVSGKFRTVSEDQTGTTGSQTAENENHQPDNNNQHNGKSHLKNYINNFFLFDTKNFFS